MLTDTRDSSCGTELFVLKLSFVNVNCGIIPEVPTVSSTLLKWDIAAYLLKLQTNRIE